MSRISDFVRRHSHRKPRRREDTLVLESCPLHTEHPDWAAKAPAQVLAACHRGADVIAFTEVHGHLIHDLGDICAANGYGFFRGEADSAMAFKMTLDAHASDVTGPDHEPFTKVEFDFHGTAVTVFGLHWKTFHPRNLPARAALTKALIREMLRASRAKRVSFYLADSNPDRPLSNPLSEPRHDLDTAGMPLVYEEVNDFPVGVGVTTIGRNRRDGRVKPVSVKMSDTLGSDHHPVTATIKVARVR